jgi:hypothetical protein
MVGKGVITSRTLEGPNRSLRALYPRRPRIWYTRSIDQRLGFYRGISFEHWAPAPPSPRQKSSKKLCLGCGIEGAGPHLKGTITL